jgi:hypothetical protein
LNKKACNTLQGIVYLKHKVKTTTETKQMTTVIKSTAKAHLVEVDGVQAWVKAAWLRADGTLTPAAVKSVEAAKKAVSTTVEVLVMKETEKAIAFEAYFTTGGYNSRSVEWEEDEQMRLVWMPKAWLTSRDGVVATMTEARLSQLRREKGGFALHPSYAM